VTIAVFAHGAACDMDTHLGKLLGDFGVGQWVPLTLMFVENLLDNEGDAIGGVKKDIKRHESAAGQLEPFIAHSTPDSGAV